MVIEKIVEIGKFRRTERFQANDYSPSKAEDPGYVTNWLIAFLAEENNSIPEIRFHAKIHDRSVHIGLREPPWRRSTEYFAVKYVLKHYLTWHLGPVHGMLAYKSVVLLTLVELAKLTVNCLDVDMGLQMMTKIARRMKKLEVLSDDAPEEEIYQQMRKDILSVFEKGSFEYN